MKYDKKRILIAFLMIILLAVVLFLVYNMLYPADWQSAAKFIKPQLKENTQIFLISRWNSPEILQFHIGCAVQKTDLRAPENIQGNSDVWIVLRGGDDKKVYNLEKDFTIEEYRNCARLKVFHLTKKNTSEIGKKLIFKDMQVSLKSEAKVKECVFEYGMLSNDCYKKDWQKIKLKGQTAAGESKVCFFVHPRQNSKILLDFPELTLKNTLTFYTSIQDEMVVGERSPVYMDVSIDDTFVKRIIQPDLPGWRATDFDTSYFSEEQQHDLSLVVYADSEEQRYYCFDAEVSEKRITKQNYFYQNLKEAKAKIDTRECSVYQDDSIWPHNEQQPPFRDSKIFERWDCEDNLIEKGKIWNTIGQSYAIADGKYREAIWMHPSTNKTTTLRYENIAIEAKTLTGHYGFNDLALLKTKDLNIELTFRIFVNDEIAYEDTFSPEEKWEEFEIAVKEAINTAEFRIETTNDKWNHFFFNAYLEF